MTGNFVYTDDIVEKGGKRFVLRIKRGVKDDSIVMTIRTRKDGKGERLAQVKGVLSDKRVQPGGEFRDATTEDILINKLYQKFKFRYIYYADIKRESK